MVNLGSYIVFQNPTIISLAFLFYDRTIANYLMWAVVKGYFHLLSSDFLEIYKNYFQQTFKVWTDTERQRLCVVATSFSFPMPLSKVFLDHIKFDAESKTRVRLSFIMNALAKFLTFLLTKNAQF